MSRYRYLSRMSSLISAEPSTGNGSGSASLSTSTSSATTSMAPVGSSGFSFPAGRCRTSPVTLTQNSARRSCATASSPRHTTCTTPLASRRSMNTTPPWSRRRATQPARTTRSPSCSARRVPASWVRIIASLPPCCRPRLDKPRLAHAAFRLAPEPRLSRKTKTRSLVPQPLYQPLRRFRRRDIVLVSALKILYPNGLVASLLGADEHSEGGTGPVRRLHRALQPATAEGHVGPDAGPAQRRDQGQHVRVRVLAEWHAEYLATGPWRSHRPFGLDCQNYTVQADREPDAGQRRAADVFGKPVVPAPAGDARLRAEQRVLELVRRPVVVVKAADQPGRVGERDAEVFQQAADRIVVDLAVAAQVVGHHRRVRELLADLGALVVEHPQRVDLGPLPGLGVQVKAAQEPLQRLP